MKNITFCILMICSWAAHAQLIITNTAETPAQLVTNVLVDNSVSPYNIKFNGSAANANAVDLRAAHFTTNFNPTNLGITAGVMLATGNAQVGLGPNNSGNLSDPVAPIYDVDTDLAAQTTNVVRNSAVLEFDFVATGSQMSFDFVFASEEYPEFSGSGFNDVFGFFLTGPNPANAAAPYNAYNIAFIPNTTTAIAINNVNNGPNNTGPCQSCAYYVNNGTGGSAAANPHVQYDGFTTVLTAMANLKCGEIYHMKLAIGNVGDNAYDSAVFLKDFKINPLNLVDGANLDENTAVCGGETNLTMPPASYFTAQNIPVPDYIANPSNYNFYWNFNNTYDPANPGAYNPAAFVPVASILLPADVNDTDYLATQGGVYSLVVETSYDCKVAEDEIRIWFQSNPLLPAPPLTICTTASLPMNININQNAAILGLTPASDYTITYYNSSALDATNGVPNGRIPNALLANYPMTTNTQDIWVRFEEVAGSGCVFVVPFTITIAQEPSGSFSHPPSYCESLPLQPIASTVTPGGTFTATPPGLNIDPVTGQVDPSASTPGSYLVDYVLPATPSCPEFRVDDVPVNITAAPGAPAVPVSLTYCEGETAPALPNAANYLWYPALTGGSSSATPLPIDTSVAGTSYYYVSQTNGCESPRATIEIIVKPKPAPPAVATLPDYCEGAVATPLGNVTGTNLRWYTGPADLVGSATAPTPSTLTPGTVFYEVTQSSPAPNACESDRAIVQVNTIALPAAPAVTAMLGYCEGVTAPDLSASATGINLLWYSSATGGIGDPVAPVPNTAAPGITDYWVSQTNAANCEGPRAQISVEVFALPTAPAFSVIQPDCATSTATITITPQGANSEYSVDNGVTFQAGNVFNGLVSGTSYDLVVRNALSQCISPSVLVNVVPAPVVPAAPVAIASTPDCNTPTAQIVVQSPLGANLEYTMDGGVTYQASPTFPNLAPNATYTIAVRDMSNTCTSAPTAVVVLPITANPAAPSFTQVNPNCDVPTGTVTITTTAADLEYSMDDGISYQATPVFSNLAPGSTVNLVVRNILTGCFSSATAATIAPLPANPAAPTASTLALVCGSNTSGFTVTSPLGSNFEYSIDGGLSYQAAATFNNLPTGANYSLTVRDIVTRCISAPHAVVIAPALNVPATPSATIIQPDCYTPTATIAITPVAGNVAYSIDGGATFQTGANFASLAPNTTYSVVVRDNVSGCISAPLSQIVDPLPANPPVPTAQITQPLCTTPTGEIVVTAPIGANFEYSIDGGTTYQATTTFASLTPNTTYTLTVRNTVTGCTAGSSQTIDPIPADPALATAIVTQPTCVDPTGAVSVSGPLGTNFEYSIDGGLTYQASVSFGNLTPATGYNVTVRNTITGCTSVSGPFNVLAAPTFPATPVASGSGVCTGETINLSTPTVAGATYNWTGPNGFVSSDQNPTIPNANAAMTGVYSVIIQTTANCPSLPGSVTIAVNPLPVPSLPQDGNICYNAVTNTVLESFVLSAGLSDAQYDFEWYFETGGSYTQISGESQSSYSASVPGNYGVIAVDTVTGCASDMVTATVEMTSPPLAIEVVASDYFDQTQTIAVTISPAGDYEYQLDNGAFQPGNVFSNVLAGEHTVKVRNACGTIEDVAFLMDYPKFFTPNGDGYNDTWNIFALKGQANAKIYIFDRYGKLLKEISPNGKGWDGTFNQNILPATDYWFSVHYQEDNVSKVFKSHFALKR